MKKPQFSEAWFWTYVWILGCVSAIVGGSLGSQWIGASSIKALGHVQWMPTPLRACIWACSLLGGGLIGFVMVAAIIYLVVAILAEPPERYRFHEPSHRYQAEVRIFRKALYWFVVLSICLFIGWVVSTRVQKLPLLAQTPGESIAKALIIIRVLKAMTWCIVGGIALTLILMIFPPSSSETKGPVTGTDC